MFVDGKVVVIVGAGPGLGATLARRCAEDGADLVLAARSAGKLEQLAGNVRAFGRRVLAAPTDVSDRDQVRALADAAHREFGRIDVLVNSAFPPGPGGPVVDMDDAGLDAWRRSLDAGGYGTLLTCRFFAPYMVEAGGGAIVNVTSMTSRMAHGGRSDYAAGKAAMHRLGWALADELGPLGVRVNAVAPGAILGEGVRGWIEGNAAKNGVTYEEQLAAQTHEMALRRIATEDEVANAILFLASDFASGITGATIDVNAGQLFG
ncbi:MAG TPA: SDR family oxidoreductase [Acidimicrobiia bacterium]|nr:SDR family oxidoreductase [Acidimicrobiia bacterium]